MLVFAAANPIVVSMLLDDLYSRVFGKKHFSDLCKGNYMGAVSIPKKGPCKKLEFFVQNWRVAINF